MLTNRTKQSLGEFITPNLVRLLGLGIMVYGLWKVFYGLFNPLWLREAGNFDIVGACIGLFWNWVGKSLAGFGQFGRFVVLLYTAFVSAVTLYLGVAIFFAQNKHYSYHLNNSGEAGSENWSFPE